MKIPRKLKKMYKIRFKGKSCYFTYKNILYLLYTSFTNSSKILIVKSRIPKRNSDRNLRKMLK